MQHSKRDFDMLNLAVSLADACPKSDQAFAVGAIIVDANGIELARGFSRELGPSFHAEETAITKALQSNIPLKGATIYSSLEPCGLRLSGKLGCSGLIIKHQIVKVVYALEEPNTFVEPLGLKYLTEAGVEVCRISGFEERVRQVNQKLFNYPS
jgi:pyrimidine deaminase RibD-like protein